MKTAKRLHKPLIIKGTLEQIKQRLNPKNSYTNNYHLCIVLRDLYDCMGITRSAYNSTKDYLYINRPSRYINKGFYNSPHYEKRPIIPNIGNWWKNHTYDYDKRKEVIKEKKRFLDHLMNKLQKEHNTLTEEVVQIKETLNLVLIALKKEKSEVVPPNVIYEGPYICNILWSLQRTGNITEEAYSLTYDYFMEERPEEDYNIDFYNSKHFNKQLDESIFGNNDSWWVPEGITKGENPEEVVTKERIDFINHILKKLK